MRLLAFTVLAMLSAGVHAGAIARATDRLPEPSDPPQGRTHWIARSMKMNGLPMTLKAFESRLGPQAVLDHYDNWFRGQAAHESRTSRNGEWRILSIQHERYFVTVRARTSLGGSVGTLAVSANPAKVASTFETQFPVPRALRIVNLQQYDDAGIEAEHISLVSSRAPRVDAANYEQLLSARGWQILRHEPTRAVIGGQLIEAQRGAEHAMLTFVPDRTRANATAIIVVWRKA